MNDKSGDSLFFDQPAIYTICVQGCIDPSWSTRLEGMTVQPSSTKEGILYTTLKGEISDQAALAGVLNTIYELHIPVISVERLTSLGKDNR